MGTIYLRSDHRTGLIQKYTEIDGRNMTMNIGQKIHPIRVNARYQINWMNSFFKNIPETPFWGKYLAKKIRKPHLGKIFGHHRAEVDGRNTKMNRGQETHPIRVNARDEMNWANSFYKKFRKPQIWPISLSFFIPRGPKIAQSRRKSIGIKRLAP